MLRFLLTVFITLSLFYLGTVHIFAQAPCTPLYPGGPCAPTIPTPPQQQAPGNQQQNQQAKQQSQTQGQTQTQVPQQANGPTIGVAAGSTVPTPCTKDCTDASGDWCIKYSNLRTAIGCIPTDPKGLIKSLLGWALGAAGGVALILMALGAIGMITSRGDPDALKSAQGRFTSAIIGLVFIIFSVLLLQIIGVQILNIPGFG